MADNIISKYYTKNDGSQIGNDVQLINDVYQNEKIINKNSGEKFVKSSNYRNVFDKVDEKISKIDDANANGVCSCKNASGVEVDTFKCHVPVSNSAPTLKWGESSTIGTVDGKPLTVKLPANPDIDTKYSAGRGLTLSGTTFSISQDLINLINQKANQSDLDALRNQVNNTTTITNIKGLFWSQQKTYSHSTEGGDTIIMPEIGQKYPGSELYQNCTYDEDSHTLVLSDPLNDGTYMCVNPSRLYLGYTASGSVYNGNTTTSDIYSESYERGIFAPVKV